MKKLILGLTMVLIAAFAAPMLAGAAPAPALYTFEECDEGWKVTENNPDAIGGDWELSPPGNPAGSPNNAFRIVPYPQAAYPDDPNAVSYEAWLTSPIHTFAAPGKVTFYLQHNLEEVPDSGGVVTGGDWVQLELSMNGGPWVAKGDQHTNVQPMFTQFEEAIPAGQAQVRFHLYSDNNTSGHGGSGGQVAVDDVELTAPRPAGTTCDGSGGGGGGGGGGGTTCTKSGNAKANTINGTSGNDVLCGKGGNDKLYGKGGKDTLVGGDGKDLLVGGPGKDTCKGGPGKDTFKGCEVKKQ